MTSDFIGPAARSGERRESPRNDPRSMARCDGAIPGRSASPAARDATEKARGATAFPLAVARCRV